MKGRWMRAAVIGTNWGRLHIHALRRSGVHVAAVCGGPADHDRTCQVAREHGIDPLRRPPRMCGAARTRWLKVH